MHNSRVSGDAMPSDDRRFDASQYAFFGKEIAEDLELGDIEEEHDNFAPAASDEFHFSSVGDQELAEAYDSLSHIDDLSSIFAKLNRAVSDPPRHTGIIGDRSSFSRDSSSTTEWMQETEMQNWSDPNLNDNNKIWWSNPSPSPLTKSNSKPLLRTASSPNQNPPPHHHPNFLNKPCPLTKSKSKPLLRTSSSPNQNPPPHHHHNFLNKPSPLTESNSKPLLRTSSSPNQNPPPHHHPNFLNKPKIAPRSDALTNLTRHSSTPAPSLSPLSSLHHSIYGNLNLNLNSVGDLSTLSNFSNFSNFSGNQGQNHLLPNLLLQQQQQQMLNPNSLIPSILLAQNQMLPSLSNYPNLHHFNRPASNHRDQRLKSSLNKHKQKDCFAPDTNFQKTDSNNSLLPQFKSKYMSSEEIQNIHKIQHVSHNNSNLYLADYYHQACLFKRGAKCQFYPSSLKDVTNTNSKSRASTENLSFLPTIRKPKPLLEAEISDIGTQLKNNFINKPLERETMVSVRMIIEDSLSILLDIDDIDRTIQLSVPNDGGYQLKKRRQILLEVLASSLQLVDPLRPGKPDNPLDHVFLLIVSLPKGTKMVSRFLKLVPVGTNLSRVVCMAVFRHLRFLFGGVPADKNASESLIDLAKTVSLSVSEFELGGLSACLAAVVCSSEQPPLRPMGSLAGDGASIALKCVLDKATELLLLSGKDCSVSSRILWQASFDAFFGLLSKYCMGKYESVVQMCFGGSADMARAIGREMPVELLRASLPHTNEEQRKILLDFAQRSMADPVHG